MADKHNANIPAMTNQIANDIPDIKENLEWHKDILQMLIGWKDDTIATAGPPNHRSEFAYSSTTAISIGTGSYFHDGTTRQTVFWDSAITFTLGSGGSNSASDDLGASEWHYIYLDDSAIVTQASPELDADCFLNDTTAPTWSATKHGWYNGSDRCIFAIYSNASSQVDLFFHDGDYVLLGRYVTILNGVQLTTSFADISTAFRMPAFSSRVNGTITWNNVDSDNDFFWRPNGSSDATGNFGTVKVDLNTTHVFFTDSSGLIEVKESGASTNTLFLWENGWYLPNAM
ncbi:MAG: hypothetical protein ACYSTX_00060 [Planctomycetota bacterium]|jgi:hypothetical protein